MMHQIVLLHVAHHEAARVQAEQRARGLRDTLRMVMMTVVVAVSHEELTGLCVQFAGLLRQRAKLALSLDECWGELEACQTGQLA